MTTIAAAADVQLVIQVLTWAFGLVGAAFIACLTWFFMRVLHQFDQVIKGVNELKDLLREEAHRLDIRITKLESWREAMIQASQTQRILEMATRVHERETDTSLSQP